MIRPATASAKSTRAHKVCHHGGRITKRILPSGLQFPHWSCTFMRKVYSPGATLLNRADPDVLDTQSRVAPSSI